MKIIDEKLENQIEELLENERRFLSIRETTKLLKQKYKINRSPQIIKRHLKSLVEQGRIIIKE